MPDLPELDAIYRFEPATEDDPDTAGVTLLVLHGASGTEDSLLAAAHRLAPGAARLSPRGPFPEDDGFRHLPRRGEDGRYDAEAVHARTGELAAFVAAATQALDLDPAKVWALGFSDGASAAAALALDHPDTLAGAVVLSGRAPFPVPKGRVLDGKKVFCATGRADETVTMDEYEELVEGIVTAGAEVQLHWYDAGHEISDKALDDARDWLRKRLAES